jgi:hypothetical protein
MASLNKVQIILPTDEGIVEYRTDISGWVGKNGRFYGKDEQLARYANSTHGICRVCESPTEHKWLICRSCQEKERYEKYLQLPYDVYMGEPVFSYGGEYFHTEDDLIDHLVDNELDEIELYPSKPIHLYQLDADYWDDCLAEDQEIPAELEVQIEKLNKVIGELNLNLQTFTEDTSKRITYKLK